MTSSTDPPNLPYRDRSEAARVLIRRLSSYRDRPGLLVLGLPRGGVPPAAAIADALNGELDVMVVRKLGVPGHRELAMGAIASGGAIVRHPAVLSGLDIEEAVFERVREEQGKELLRRETAYRGERPFPDLENRCVILVDDGLATGSTMRAAIEAVRQRGAEHIVVAVPVAPPDTVRSLTSMVDEVVCPAIPAQFMAIGQFYDEFTQVTDEQVVELLRTAWDRATPAAEGAA